jgi:hypothetical protein
MLDSSQLEKIVWAVADGRASEDDLALFRADEWASLAVLDRLITDTEEDLASVRGLPPDMRDQVVADFLESLDGLLAAEALLRPPPPPEPGEEPQGVLLQATWAEGQLVVWGGGRATPPADAKELATRLQAAGAPPQGWLPFREVPVPDLGAAAALTIPVRDALGWLVAIGAQGGEGVGASLLWMGRVAIEGVRLVVNGAVVPSVRYAKGAEGRLVDAAVKWLPALVDTVSVDQLGRAMPPTVISLGGADGRATATSVIGAVTEAIVLECLERMELPAPPPTANSLTDLEDTVIARMDASGFRAPPDLVMVLSRKLSQWAKTVTSQQRPRLVVGLAAPDDGGVWMLSVHASNNKSRLTPVDEAIRQESGTRLIAAEWARLVRLYPVADRSGAANRGTVALSQPEAWELMTAVGPVLTAAGFDVRVPALSTRKARPSLRLFAEATAGSTGANALSKVAWSVLFDDVELTAADIARLAREARPLVKSRGQWVEVDRVDLEKAAAALAERESVTRLTNAEILRHSMGLDGSGLAGGVVVGGTSWASEIVRRAGEVSTELITRPDGFRGELRTYQGEALGWLAFLDGAELGGCLALDMGLGKTPTVLAHLARTKGSGPVLVIAPAAVVGNWASEAAKFAPELRVVVHHGAARADTDEIADEVARADVLITTYATAVRDVDGLAGTHWARIVLDEAQAIKNPASETAQQLRRLPARSRIALTGTPIENGLGDLWAILDFTNPGLVGPRASFMAQMSGDGEAALRALNGILLFRRTKTEPEVAAELPDKIDELDHCTMTPEQIGLYQAVLDALVLDVAGGAEGEKKQGAVLAAITALKQICNHPCAYQDDGGPLTGRSGKLSRLEELIDAVFAAGERILIFTHFATWGRRLAEHLSAYTGHPIACYDGSLARGVRDKMVADFQTSDGAGAMVLSLKAGGTGLNLTAANHVVLYDRWWNPAVEDQARDRAWRIGQTKTVISHRLVCPGTVDERVEEVVEGKRHIAELVLPRSSSLADLSTDQLRIALGIRPDEILTEDS